MKERMRASCPSCELRFAKSKSNQRYCSTPCARYGANVRAGMTKRIDPKELRERHKMQAQQALLGGRDRKSITTPTNPNANALEIKAYRGDLSGSRVMFDGWRGYDACRGHYVFLPLQTKPLSRLECIALGMAYPAIDRGVYRITAAARVSATKIDLQRPRWVCDRGR